MHGEQGHHKRPLHAVLKLQGVSVEQDALQTNDAGAFTGFDDMKRGRKTAMQVDVEDLVFVRGIHQKISLLGKSHRIKPPSEVTSFVEDRTRASVDPTAVNLGLFPVISTCDGASDSPESETGQREKENEPRYDGEENAQQLLPNGTHHHRFGCRLAQFADPATA